ncbi:quinon protein alcohol dehydrogenase-like superfamily [Lactarius akahatsu]|uniref:Quinon protein alcohol dehydrogenase-like superfamily n=1 Tax=Lactarius akahatsu TaxID=416441 RepID=A0AAD4LCK8_9AGAM|nr:quinon protein alcohol dehydrogenase-like superfamily [Lactarius akahatsu]
MDGRPCARSQFGHTLTSLTIVGPFSETRGVNPFCCGEMAGQTPSIDRIRIAKSQGSRSQPVSVEMAGAYSNPKPVLQASSLNEYLISFLVIRARNVPHIKTTFGGKREFFLTIAHRATAMKTKKQSKKRTKSVHIDDGRMAVWDQMLDASFLQPSSQPILRFYAKRSRKSDILCRTHETVIPTEFESDICFVLGHVNGQAEHSSWVTSVAFSPDGQRIVSGCFDRTNRLMNATTGDTEADPIHTDSVWSMASSPDGQRIVSRSQDRRTRVWNATTGDTEAGPFSGHRHWITSVVAFSPDGHRIVSGSEDRTIRVWNATTGDAGTDPFTGR